MTMISFMRGNDGRRGTARSRAAGAFGRGCAVLTALCGGLLTAACSRQPQALILPPSEVSTVTVGQKEIQLTTELPGRTAPYLIAEIRPQVNGLILKRLFTEGSDVKAGQTLYEIDPAPFNAALHSAEASLAASRKAADRARAALAASAAGVARAQATADFARINRQRFEELFKEKAVSATDRDEAATAASVADATLQAADAQVQSDKEAVSAAVAAIAQAEAALETARINLGYTKIAAPICGRIGKSAVTDGAIVTAYQPVPLAVIQQLDPIYVDVPQSTAEQLRLRRRLEQGRMNRDEKNANKVQLLLEDGSRYAQGGTLQFSDVSVDPTTGSVILRMVFPNPDNALLPSMFVRAVIQEGVNAQAVLIPQQTVSRDTKGNPYALVVNAQEQAEVRPLALDRAIGDQWLIAGGLKPGDRVIAEGLQRVRPGAPVKAVPFESARKQPQAAGQPPSAAKK